MINKEYEILLNEGYIDEVLDLLLKNYISLFAKITNEQVDWDKNLNLEKMFIWFYWKAFKYSNNYIEEMITLNELFYDINWHNGKGKDILCRMEKLYYKIKEKANNNEKLNIAEFLKSLSKNNQYEFAISIIQNTYYYPIFIKLLNDKNIKFERYADFSDIMRLMKINYEEYQNILLKIEGIYPYEITLKERLNSLMYLSEAFE